MGKLANQQRVGVRAIGAGGQNYSGDIPIFVPFDSMLFLAKARPISITTSDAFSQ